MHLNSLQNLFYTVIILYIRQEYKILQKTFFSPRNRCLKRSYKGIYKTFNLFIYLDNGQWTHGGCRSAPMFFRSKNSHVFSPPAPTKFPNNKTVGYSPTPNKRKALDLASEKQLDNCIRFFPSS